MKTSHPTKSTHSVSSLWLAASSFFIILIFLQHSSLAQSPQSFKYQSVARNSNGLPIASANIGLRVSVHDLTATGSVVYRETHTAATNAFGVFTVSVGGGAVVSGNFSTIAWGSGAKYIEVEADFAGGSSYTSMGTSQLLSVPYALYSQNGTPGPQGPIGLTGAAGTNGTNGTNGAVGATGPQGTIGLTGAQGPIGLTGATGSQGIQGIQGSIGLTGSTGAQGLAGTNGNDGLTTSVNGVTQVAGAITLTKSDIGLNNVDNTADSDKPISNAIQTGLNLKVDKEAGKGLSTSDYTNADATKVSNLSGINTGDQDITAMVHTNRAELDAVSGTNTGDQDLSGKVDKIVGKGLSTNDYTAAEQTKLAAITGVNTGDQTLPTLSSLGAVAVNTAITGATKTKVTYDAKGLVTAGADATTADIAGSADKNYVTDAQLVIIENASGVNTGDNAINALYTGLVSNAVHTGDVIGSSSLTIANKQSMIAIAPVSVSGSPIVISANPVTIAIASATASSAGSMSAADKIKLDALPVGANAGEMNYWNGTTWVTIAPGTTGQTLTFCNGVPTWGPCPSFTLTVATAGTGNGTVASSPVGINCGGDCTEPYNPGTTVTLTATPNAGSTFTGWSGGGCSGTGTCSATMNNAVSVTATFTASQFSFTVVKAGTGNGTVTSNPAGISCGVDCTEPYNSGTVVTLTATPNAGSTFTGWSGGGCSGTGTCSATMNNAVSVTATFTASQFSLTVGKAGSGSGNVTSIPAGINCPADCIELYNSGTVVTLTAVPGGVNSAFTGWTGGGCAGTGTCTITMDNAVSVTATFIGF